jgi:hypothetical protein
MEKEKKETVTCPNCNKALEIEVYGFGVECSECGQGLDVFPDKSIRINSELFGEMRGAFSGGRLFIYTKQFGEFEIELPLNGNSSKGSYIKDALVLLRFFKA